MWADIVFMFADIKNKWADFVFMFADIKNKWADIESVFSKTGPGNGMLKDNWVVFLPGKHFFVKKRKRAKNRNRAILPAEMLYLRWKKRVLKIFSGNF